MAVGAVSTPADVPEGSPPAEPVESDFSARKIRIACAILLGQTFASSLVPFVALSYVLPSMTKEFGWSRTEFLGANTALLFVGALVSWPMGVLTDRIGARPIILVGTLGVGLMTLLVPFVQSDPGGVLPRAWQFYAIFALIGLFGCCVVSYSKVTTALFTQNRGKAMAILGAEGTVARMIIPGLTAFIILQHGWRGLFTTIGIVVLAVVPVLFLFLEEPGTRGLKPSLSFRKPAAAPGSRATVVAFDGMTFSEVLGDKVFWLLLLAGLLAISTGNGMLANITASLIDRGFSLQTIGNVDSAATLAGIPGVLLAGFLMDKIPSPKVAVPFHLLTAVSAVLYMTVTPTHGGATMLLAARCLFNFAFTASLPLSAYLMTRFFGLKAYASIYGLMAGIQALGASVAPLVFGRVYDVTHSYRIGYEAWTVAVILAALIIVTLPRYRFSANLGAMPAAPKSGPGAGVSRAAAPAE
jgi:sugar phosphate permease